MFEAAKTEVKPRVSDTNVEGKPDSLDPDGEVRDSWTNPHLFYEIAQKMMRERGEL
jgi:hypothetical protein